MSKISENDKLYFLISISKRRLNGDASYEQALDFWYHKPQYKDIYEAVTKIAFTTLARTVRGLLKNPNHDVLHREAETYLEERLANIKAKSQDEFDVWHRETANHLIEIFKKNQQDFTVGQAQKWINMALKHLAIADYDKVQDVYTFCHIPIDSYIIKGLKSDLVSPKIREIDCTFSQYVPLTGIAAWSKISNYETYLKFQKELREKCGEAPLDFEFHLWQKQNDLTKA